MLRNPKTQRRLTIKGVLIEAIDLLEKEGWGQSHAYNRDNGCYCPMGAINKAIFGEANCSTSYSSRLFPELYSFRSEVVKRLESWILISPLQPLWRIVAIWNDDEHQTRENVIATMRRAANRKKNW